MCGCRTGSYSELPTLHHILSTRQRLLLRAVKLRRLTIKATAQRAAWHSSEQGSRPLELP